jgi:hypothetical protein
MFIEATALLPRTRHHVSTSNAHAKRWTTQREQSG